MERLIIIGLLLGVMLYEWIRSFIVLMKIQEKEKFSISYRNKIIEYSNHGNEQDFQWLATNAMKMQHYMGGMGVVTYTPPFAQYYVNNYLVIVNGIDEVRNERGMGMGYNDQARMLGDALTKFYGSLVYKRERLISDMKNPLKLLSGGIKSILMMPLALFKEVGLFSSRLYETISENIIVRIITAVATLVSVVSALVSLVIGWEAFLAIIKEFGI